MATFQSILQSVQPVFSFMLSLWSAIPSHVSYIIAAFFAFFVGFTVVRNFLS